MKPLECAELVEDDFDRVELYKYLAQEYIDNKQYQQYDLALTILKQIESLSGKVHLLISISDKYIQNGEYKKARETLQEAIEVLSKVKDSKNLYMLPEIANLYAQMGDYYSAINTVKLIPTDTYQAETLAAIALTYAKSPQAINPETFEVLESLI